jgi:hypothetical protein
LKILGIARNHHIGLGDRLTEEAQERWLHKGHVAGQAKAVCGLGGDEPGVDATQRASLGNDVGEHRQAKALVLFGGIGDQDHFCSHLLHDLDHTLDQ